MYKSRTKAYTFNFSTQCTSIYNAFCVFFTSTKSDARDFFFYKFPIFIDNGRQWVYTLVV